MNTISKKLINLCLLTLVLVLHASQVLAAPASNVAATDGLWAGWVDITWVSNYIEGFHNVERSVSANGTYTRVAQLEIGVSNPDNKYRDTTAVTGTRYYYRIRTCFDITCETSSSDVGWRGYLNAVRNINASDSTSSDHTQVSWSSVTNADIYEVFRSSTVGGTKTLAGTSTSPLIFFLDTEVTPAQSIYYHVRACKSGIVQCSEFYDYDQGKRAWPVVENVVASDGGHVGFVRVTWDAVSGASGYRVYYSSNGGTNYFLEGDTVAAPYDFYKELAGFEYWFAITPCFDTVCGSTRSQPDIGWLDDYPAPANLQASDGGSFTDVRWDEVDTNAWYFVFRDLISNPSGKTLVESTGSDEFFRDNFAKGALLGTLYNYWVIACPYTAANATDPGCSSFSKPDSGYYLPGEIKNLAASDGTSQDHILVTWDAIDGASLYAVERTTNISDPSPVWTGPYNSTTNQYKDTSVVEGVKYWYIARACGKDYCGNTGNNDTGYLQGVCYALTLTTIGNGSVTAGPKNSLGCLEGEYIEGEKIKLNASADPGWNFESWANTDDDSSTSVQNYLTMPAGAHAVSATFSIACESLFLEPTAGGHLQASPESSKGCEAGYYAEGEVVTLDAHPDDSTWVLAQWIGTDDDSSTESRNQLTMTAAPATVTAKFSRQCEVLSLNTVGNGSLWIEPDASEGCPSGSFAAGEWVGLYADADPGWHIAGWSGTDDDTVTLGENQYTMTAGAHTVTVTFEPDCNELLLNWHGGGTVTASPVSSNGCPTGTYIPGAVINLKAIPDDGWQLSEWLNTDDDSSTALTNTCTMRKSDLAVWAVFKPDTATIFSSGFEGKDP